MPQRQRLGDSSAKRFLSQIGGGRLLWIAVIGATLAGSVAADLATSWWDASPFATNVVSSVLLLGLTVLLLDEYLSFRAAQVWEPVGEYALEDLGRVSRDVWLRLATHVQPEQKPTHVEEYRARITSAAGRARQRARMIEIVERPEDRLALYDVLHGTADDTRELVLRWAPTLVARAPLAGYLAEFSRLHRRIIAVLKTLHVAELQPLPVTPGELAEQILAIGYLAEDLDRRVFAEAAEADS